MSVSASLFVYVCVSVCVMHMKHCKYSHSADRLDLDAQPNSAQAELSN